MKAKWIVAFITFIACISVAFAADTAPTGWFAANRITLKMNDEGLNYNATWNFDRGENGDFKILLNENRAGEARAGRIFMIENQALLVKDLALTESQVLPALDGPSLMLQLTLKLLKKAFPDGPQSISEDMNIDIASDGKAIKVNTPTASANFSSPWLAKGILKKEIGDRISFDIKFNAANAINSFQSYAVHFSGVWQIDKSAAVFPDTMPLKDWQFYSIGPLNRNFGDASLIEFGVRKRDGFATLGELRKHIAKGWATEIPGKNKYQCTAEFP